MKYYTFAILIIFTFNIAAQETVTDFDGNVYNTVTIGNQVWLKENLKSLHYADGIEIPGVANYNNSDSLANIYGRLYNWDAAMRNSTIAAAQGVAPDGWHIPTDAEWIELENYLGGPSLAGGKMKIAGTLYWDSPNTGADNSSGFSALPGGEFDAHYAPNVYRLINTHAVFWTSTQTSSTKARERYLAFDSKECSIYDWYKVMKYSIRCIKNTATDIQSDAEIKLEFDLKQNYPNPFNPSTIIQFFLNKSSHISLKINNILGIEVAELVNEIRPAGSYHVTWNGRNETGNPVSSGIYFYTLKTGNKSLTKKMLLIQ